VPQGSPKIIQRKDGRASLANDPKLKAWRSFGAVIARNAVRHSDHYEYAERRGKTCVFDEPILVGVDYYLERPKKPRFEAPAAMPDLDKLLRALGDMLSVNAGIIWDDAMIVGWDAQKRWADEENPAGTYVWIERSELR